MNLPTKNKIRILAAGDTVVIAAITVIGFATHGESSLGLLPRMLTTFIPLTLSWFLLAPLIGLFNLENISDPRQLWRPLAGMVFSGPLAVLLRAILLNTVVIPVFGIVLSATAGLSLLVWRSFFFGWVRAK